MFIMRWVLYFSIGLVALPETNEKSAPTATKIRTLIKSGILRRVEFSILK